MLFGAEPIRSRGTEPFSLLGIRSMSGNGPGITHFHSADPADACLEEVDMNMSRLIYCTLVGLLMTLFSHTAVCAQGNLNRNIAASNAQVQQATQNTWLAESIVASRESASGRSFDPVYRASLKNSLALLPAGELESLRHTGSKGRLNRGSVGDSNADLVYTPVTPCRVFDTRSSTAGILVGDTQRNFLVAGTAAFPDQGGNDGGCGIPHGSATAVLINFAAVAPTGAGNLRAWAVADPQPDAPLAAVMNFSTGMYALANGVVVPLCDPTVTNCTTGDLRLQADVSSVHVVGDVVGYFRKLDLPMAMPMGSESLASFDAIDGNQFAIGTRNIVLPHNGSCLVTCNINVEATALNSTGGLGIKTARYDPVTAASAADSSWVMNVPLPSRYGSASTTFTWSMTGGQAYRFGCMVGAAGDFVGENLHANVSWICR